MPWAPGQPGVVREAADGLAELGAHQHQGVALVVALLVEGGRFEAVLRGSEEFLNPDRAVEDVLQEAELLRLQLTQEIRCSKLLQFRFQRIAEDD